MAASCGALCVTSCSTVLALLLALLLAPPVKPRPTPRNSPTTWKAGARLPTLQVAGTGAVTTRTVRAVYIRRLADGFPVEQNYGLLEFPLPELTDGQVLVKHRYLSMDPGPGRGQMGHGGVLLPEIDPHDTKLHEQLWRIPGTGGVGEVIESRAADLPAGVLVRTGGAWTDLLQVPASALHRLPESMKRPSSALGLEGSTGITAYIGIAKVLEAKAGQVMFVSGAAGATGSVAGQLGKFLGCRVLGSAGTDEKVRHLYDLGFDGAFNYRSEDPSTALERLAPDGIDLFFENTGGPVSEAVLHHLRDGARVAISGLISTYHEGNAAEYFATLLSSFVGATGPAMQWGISATIQVKLLVYGYFRMWHATIGACDRSIQKKVATIGANTIHVENFLCACSHFGPWADMEDELATLESRGFLNGTETVLQGSVEDAPRAFIHMMSGGNTGKLVLELTD